MTATCDFIEMGELGPVFCLAPPLIDIRWRWRVEVDHPDHGAMCEGHWLIACEQLAADPDIEYESIQIMRRGEVT